MRAGRYEVAVPNHFDRWARTTLHPDTHAVLPVEFTFLRMTLGAYRLRKRR